MSKSQNNGENVSTALVLYQDRDTSGQVAEPPERIPRPPPQSRSGWGASALKIIKDIHPLADNDAISIFYMLRLALIGVGIVEMASRITKTQVGSSLVANAVLGHVLLIQVIRSHSPAMKAFKLFMLAGCQVGAFLHRTPIPIFQLAASDVYAGILWLGS
jgi:hypothetical protein